MIEIRRAFFSAADRAGLAELGVELLASRGTARFLRQEGIEVGDITNIGYPELVGGRVKTLHPLIHAGILARRDDPADLADVERYGIELLDLVVVNLSPFQTEVDQATLYRRGAGAGRHRRRGLNQGCGEEPPLRRGFD